MPAIASSANLNDLPRRPFDHVVYVQNCENARHLRTVRVLSANAFAVVIAACLTALQLVRADRLVELTSRHQIVDGCVHASQTGLTPCPPARSSPIGVGGW
jgi:hypothetical protein